MASVSTSTTANSPLPYQCINCTAEVPLLYLKYPNPGNTAPIECSRCHEELDVYQTLVYEVVLVDLLLLRERVYRHLLVNRATGGQAERQKERGRSLWRVGGVVIALDAYVRTASASVGPPESLRPFYLFCRTFLYCILETASFDACLAASAWVLLALFPSKQSTTKNLRLLPLTLSYSSFASLFLLLTFSVYAKEYANAPPASTSLRVQDVDPATLSEWGRAIIRFSTHLSRASLTSKASRIGNATGWANEAVVRKAVGGSSAVVGVSVLLNVSKRKTVLVLVVAWLLHLVLLHTLDPWIA